MTKVAFLVKEQNVSVIPLTSVEYHDVLHNTSLSRMNVYHFMHNIWPGRRAH